ncbi:TetR/AcrR family transcriptional regulator [Mycobacterium sp. 663a-19]|uniref:TetR/AcrR family transcriptional regulator n=1 Tax=Mycobacterium sp. 663a-19 TaxID=2986148 RepID=UPI002D1EACD0|nr:TetR/AcrR family transcriptional regulator [Mycobacterium sp. 663a-19]MEB3979912.1 TetR/AcrR family transcriptional regulator [Mycobacterium sp. 663a-19]
MRAQANESPRGREAQRLETRQRVYDAAMAEFKRSGMADADIGAIISAAGIARGTFYFHFPTKEHVLEEVERNLVTRLAGDLTRFVASEPDLWSTMSEVVRLVVAAESRLGTRLFRDVLALHFSQTRPPGFGKPTDHPLVALLAQEIARAQLQGVTHPDASPENSALFFLLGIYALLVTHHDSKPARSRVIGEFVASTRRGLEAR